MEETKRRLFVNLRELVGDARVIQAMESVPREAFVPVEYRHLAYEDIALPIGENQTISQPYIVAMMVSALEIRRTDKLLEIGTGSGYQAAILSRLANRVISMERISTLADSARELLESLGYDNVEVNLAGEDLGWPEGAPYDGIIVAAGAPRLPTELIDQMAVRGRMVVPVGDHESQELMKVIKTRDGFTSRSLGACKFVPLIGKGAWPRMNSHN